MDSPFARNHLTPDRLAKPNRLAKPKPHETRGTDLGSSNGTDFAPDSDLLARLRSDSSLFLHPAGVVTVTKASASKRAMSTARSWLKRRADEGILTRILDGSFVLTDVWTTTSQRDAIVALAAGLTHPGAAISGRAAALLHGLPVFSGVTCIDLLTTSGAEHKRPTIGHDAGQGWRLRFHRVKSHEGCTVSSHSVRFTTLTSTLFHVARDLPQLEYGAVAANPGNLEQSTRVLSYPEFDANDLDASVFLQHAECLAMAESAIRGEAVPAAGNANDTGDGPQQLILRREPICRSALLELCSAQRRSPGKHKAEALLRHANELSESPFESMTKLLLIVMGLQFVQQARIVDENHTVVARVDFLLTEYGVVVETDGMNKYSSDSKVRSDRRRDFRMTNLGYSVCHLTWKDVATLRAVEILLQVIRAQLQRTEAPRGSWFPSHFRLPSSYYQWDK